MSCRERAAGSFATTYIRALYDLEDGQCTSIYHHLLREHDNGRLAVPSSEEFHEHLWNMRQRVHDDPAWAGGGLRNRALSRAESVVHSQPTEAERTALLYLLRDAAAARTALDTTFRTIAAVHSSPRRAVSADAIRAEFRRLYRTTPTAATRGATLPAGFPPVTGLPGDARTAHALTTLFTGSRCISCGQFTAMGGTHTCPAGTSPVIEERPVHPSVADAVARALAEDAQNTPRRPRTLRPREVQPPAPQPEEAPVQAWDMDDFQSVYDRVREEIAAGNTRIATDEELEAVPGGVTGGLGAPGTGNTFGIELEIDFPDDDYPYSARYAFAQLLYREGITATPDVERWHFVGDNRPGGTFGVGPDNWICEFDRSVDDVDGERGVEIKSQILSDEPKTWANLRRICQIAEELGGQATMRTGLHVNVGGGRFPSADPAAHNNLLRLASAFDDTIVRLAHNPESGPTHRGRTYCQHVHVPPAGFHDVGTARAYANHYQAFNLGHLPAEGERHTRSSRVEVRVFDSTLDPGRIQAAVTLSLALVEGGIRGIAPGQDPEPAGTHRERHGSTKLSGEDWAESTASFRRVVGLLDRLGAGSAHHKAALTKMFAVTKWQNR